MKHPVLVAVDGGSGNIAVRYTKEDGNVHQFLMRSVVRRGHLQQGSRESNSTWQTADGEIYSVTSTGSKMELIDTCDPAYQISAANRVLVIDALVKAGLADRDIILADTLPADQFYGENGIDTARIEAKKASLMQPVTSYTGKVKAPRIKEVRIFPEAVPAFVSASIRDDGTNEPEMDHTGNTIVVDIGRFTCDIAVLDAHNDVIGRATTENGIHVMIKRLQALLIENEADLGVEETKEISPAALDDIIRNGYIGPTAEARKHLRTSIEHLATTAAKELSDRIREDVRALHRSLADIEVLLVVGGGANWLGGKLSYLPNFAEGWHPKGLVFIPEEPEMAVVRGVHILASGELQELTED